MIVALVTGLLLLATASLVSYRIGKSAGRREPVVKVQQEVKRLSAELDCLQTNLERLHPLAARRQHIDAHQRYIDGLVARIKQLEKQFQDNEGDLTSINKSIVHNSRSDYLDDELRRLLNVKLEKTQLLADARAELDAAHRELIRLSDELHVKHTELVNAS